MRIPCAYAPSAIDIRIKTEQGEQGELGKQGELGELGKLTQNSTLPIAHSRLPIPCSLTNDK